MVRVHILGGPGSGKTTLAQEIASRLHGPHYDLDQLGRKNGTCATAWVEDAFAIAGEPGWVVEGIYLLFVDPLLYQADYIVLLDIAWPAAAWRIIRRHITNSLRGTNQYPGLKPLFKLLRYARAYYLAKRPDTAEVVRRYLEEESEIAAPPVPESVLTNLETYSAIVIPPTAEFVRRYLGQYQEKVFLVRKTADRERLLKLLASLLNKSGESWPKAC